MYCVIHYQGNTSHVGKILGPYQTAEIARYNAMSRLPKGANYAVKELE